MPDQSIQWNEAEFPVLEMDENVDPVVLPEGKFSYVKNAEYTTISGSIRKRPGLDLICSNATIPAGNRLGTYKDQLLVVDTNGNVATDPALYAPELAAKSYKSVATAIPVTVERTPISSDLTSALVADMAMANGFLVYIVSNPQAGIVTIKVKEINSDSYVNEARVFSNNTKLTDSVRAAASGSYVLCTFNTSDGNIRGVIVNCSGTVPSIGASSVLVSDEAVSTSAHHDLVGSTLSTSRWFLTYKWDLAGVLTGRVYEIKGASMTLGWHRNFGDNPSAFSSLEHNSNLWLNWYSKSTVTDPGNVGTQEWMYLVLDSIVGSTTFISTAWCNDTDLGGVNDISSSGSTFNPGRVSGIAPHPTSSTTVLLFHSQPRKYSTSASDAITRRPMLRWRTADTSGSLGTLNQKRGAHLWCKPWLDTTNNSFYAWVGTSGRVAEGVSSTAGESSWTLALLRIVAGANSALLDATAVGERLGNPNYNWNGTWGNDHCAQSTVIESETSVRTLVAVRYVPGEEISGPHEIRVRKDHLGRYKSAEFGGATYFTGGALTQWDGERYAENNCVNPPLVRIKRTAGTGTWDGTWVGKKVGYRVVYETTAPNGEVTRSAISDLEELATGDEIAATTDIITLTIEPATLTRRYWGPNYQLTGPQVVAVVYRTDIPDSSIMKKVATFDLGVYNDFLSCDPETTEPLTVVDKGDNPTGSASAGTLGGYTYYNIESHEIIYTDSGEVENTLPYGGCTTICVHKNRLWIAGGEDQELIWYSKERADGRPAEFSLDQQIRLAGQKITALESTGDLLVIFCEDGIFEISGDGPNPTADPASGTFSQAFQISPTGTSQPNSIAYIPDGLIYRSSYGIHLVTFNKEVVWIGRPVKNTVEAFPVVEGVCVIAEKSQVRFALREESGNLDGSGPYGITLVYDWDEDRWAIWDYANMDYQADIIQWGDKTVILNPNGKLYEENQNKFLDDTSFYGMLIITAWFKFGRLQGYKKIRKFGILMEKLGSSFGLDVQAHYNYTTSGLTATKSFSPTEIAAIPFPGWIRITSPYQKQPSIRLMLTETEDPRNSDTAAFALKSFAFEIGMIPGLKRLPAGQTK